MGKLFKAFLGERTGRSPQRRGLKVQKAMKPSWPNILITLFSAALWLVGFPVSWLDSWWGLFPFTAYFLSFAAGIFSWGLVAERRLGGGAAAAWLFSSLAAVVFAFFLGHVGLLGMPGHWLFLAGLHLGLLFLPWSRFREALVVFRSPWLNFVLFFIFGLRFLSAFLPQGHGDPLLYHLMGPRLWNLMGSVQLNPDLPIPFLAASWEYFSSMAPRALLPSSLEPASIPQLVAAQIFSQWIHLTWGLFGSIVVLRQLAEGRAGITSERRLALLLLALLFVPSLQWTGALAKNDCGMAFWSLGAWFFLLRESGA